MCEAICLEGGRAPDCLACLPPLRPENEAIVNVFLLVQDQVILAPGGSLGGGGGVVGLNQLAIHACMELYECASPRVFEAVVALGRRFCRSGGNGQAEGGGDAGGVL